MDIRKRVKTRLGEELEACDKFTSLDELLLAEVVIDNFEIELNKLKIYFNVLMQNLSKSSSFEQYDHKKMVITSFVNCNGLHQSSLIAEMLVIFFFLLLDFLKLECIPS